MLHTILMIVHFFCAAGIVALVLLQRGKGAEAGAGFGAGASGTVFGARGAGTALSHATAVLFAIFMVTSLTLAYVGTRKAAAPPSSLLDQLTHQPATPSSGTGGAGSSTEPKAEGPPPGLSATPAAPTEVPPGGTAPVGPPAQPAGVPR